VNQAEENLNFGKPKPNPGRGWWSRLVPATKRDLDQAEARILAAVREGPSTELKAAAERLRHADEALKAALAAQNPGTKGK
jgi:hypothetical protein